MENLSTYIRPVCVPIGTSLDNIKTDDAKVMEYTTHQMVLIPLEKTLKFFLELPLVLEQILNYIDSETTKNYISSIFNTKLWTQILANNRGKLVLPLVMYYDDYETGNPLGTSAGLHRVGAFYTSVIGVPPKYASRLENIFLTALYYSHDRTRYGNKSILKNIFKIFSHLEQNGITVKMNYQEHHIYFYLVLVIGDNLGMNSLLGYSESFSSTYYCRICTCSRMRAQNLFIKDESCLRTPTNYAVDLSNHNHGIKEYCILNNLSNFHVAINTSVDVMHDLFEGICRYDLGKILFHSIKERKMFSLIELHRRIKYFDHDTNIEIGNKIPLISTHQIDQRKIIMSSSEMYSFLVFLPFLIGDLVDFDDDCWHLILYKIVQIVMKNCTNAQELIYLKHLIKEHHELCIKCFNEPLKLKYHLLTHYPTIIQNVGPLNIFSSMRYESFHRVGKSSAHVICNRKNIIYSLAVRYQLKLNYRFLSKTGLTDQIEFGRRTFSKEISNEISDYLKNKYSLVTCITFNGIKYKLGSFIQISKTKYDDPRFAKICAIICDFSNNILFYCLLAENLGHDHDYMGYDILEKQNKKIFVDVSKLHFNPVKVHTIHGGRTLISCFNQG